MSGHSHHHSDPVPEIQLGSRATSVERLAGVIGGLGILVCVAGYFWNRDIFFQSYLFSFLYWSGFTLGGLGLFLLNNVVGGRWGVTTRSFLIAAARTMPVIIVLLAVLILLGLNSVYPWLDPAVINSNQYFWHKKVYLTTFGYTIRMVIYFGIFILWLWRARKMADQQDRDGNPGWVVRMRQWSAPGLLLFVLAITFAYFDWILSADVQFYSSVYGAMILAGDAMQTFALTIIVLIMVSKADRFAGRVNSKLLHDLGNMMFVFTIFWAYLSAAQLIIIWPANLPQELQWYLVRVTGGWRAVAAIVAITMFGVPFLALLSQARKRDPRRLMRMAFWLLGARAIELFWLSIPTWRTKGFEFHWTDIATWITMGGIWVYVYLGYLRRRPLLPMHDPRIMPAIREVAA